MSDLKKQADELGIKIDNRWGDDRWGDDRWGDDRIQQEIDKELAKDGNEKPAEAKSKDVPVKINRDFWDAEGNRHRKGTIIDVSVEDALDGVESGALSRVK